MIKMSRDYYVSLVEELAKLERFSNITIQELSYRADELEASSREDRDFKHITINLGSGKTAVYNWVDDVTRLVTKESSQEIEGLVLKTRTGSYIVIDISKDGTDIYEGSLTGVKLVDSLDTSDVSRICMAVRRLQDDSVNDIEILAGIVLNFAKRSKANLVVATDRDNVFRDVYKYSIADEEVLVSEESGFIEAKFSSGVDYDFYVGDLGFILYKLCNEYVVYSPYLNRTESATGWTQEGGLYLGNAFSNEARVFIREGRALVEHVDTGTELYSEELSEDFDVCSFVEKAVEVLDTKNAVQVVEDRKLTVAELVYENKELALYFLSKFGENELYEALREADLYWTGD